VKLDFSLTDEFQAEVSVCNLNLGFSSIVQIVKDKPCGIIIARLRGEGIKQVTRYAIALHTPFLFPELFLPVKSGLPVELQTKGSGDRRLSGFVTGADAVVRTEAAIPRTGGNRVEVIALVANKIPGAVCRGEWSRIKA